jgi:hypothetical protein
MVEIILSSDAPHFSQEHQIFGQTYTLEFEWIEREEYWVMHLYDVGEQPIALGLKVSRNWPIYADPHHNIGFVLVVTNPTAKLNLATLYRDFMLVAYEIV